MAHHEVFASHRESDRGSNPRRNCPRRWSRSVDHQGTKPTDRYRQVESANVTHPANDSIPTGIQVLLQDQRDAIVGGLILVLAAVLRCGADSKNDSFMKGVAYQRESAT